MRNRCVPNVLRSIRPQSLLPVQKNPTNGGGILKCCRGRSRTSTGQLAVVQRLVVNPGRLHSDSLRNWNTSRLYATFILDSPPPRREGMSAKDFITPQYKEQTQKYGRCRRRSRTSTGSLARLAPVLSDDPHPRDERACLPKISSSHSICSKNLTRQTYND